MTGASVKSDSLRLAETICHLLPPSAIGKCFARALALLYNQTRQGAKIGGKASLGVQKSVLPLPCCYANLVIQSPQILSPGSVPCP
jgi:hypothetical protein